MEHVELTDLWFEQGPYTWEREVREQRLLAKLKELTGYHRKQCEPYRKILHALQAQGGETRLEELPFLPVSLFKTTELRSVP